jgi:hypothetical protein
MTGVSWLLAPEMVPFSVAIGLVAGLLMLEIVALLLGGSLFGADADGIDIDTGVDAEVGLDLEGADGLSVDAQGPDFGGPDFDGPDFDGADFDGADVDGPDIDSTDAGAESPVGAGSGILSWLGIGEVPFAIWLAGMLTAFGLVGYGLQVGAVSIFGALLPAVPAAALALVPALWAGRGVARAIGRLVPRTHSEAVSQRHLGGRIGVITTGTAAVGRPAQARVTDRYGNIQYLRVEPFKPGKTLTEGTEIAVLWGRGPVYQAVPLDEVKPRDSVSKEN